MGPARSLGVGRCGVQKIQNVFKASHNSMLGSVSRCTHREAVGRWENSVRIAPEYLSGCADSHGVTCSVMVSSLYYHCIGGG